MSSSRRSVRPYAVRLLAVVLAAVALAGSAIYMRYRGEIARHEERIARSSKIVDTPCGRIEYGKQGEGEPILALHGAGGGYDQGLLMADMAGSGYRIVAPSRFGFLNTPLPADTSVAAQADAYVCLLDHLQIERAHVIAISAGGPSALQFALRHPQRVTTLILVSALSTLRPVRDGAAGPSAAMLTDWGYWAVISFAPSLALDALGLPAAAQANLSPVEQERTMNVLQMMLPMARRAAGNNTDVVEQNLPEIETLPIKNITAPTLVIHAVDDTLVPFAQGQYSADHIPGAQLVRLEEGGHLAIVKDAVWDTIRAFIAKHS